MKLESGIPESSPQVFTSKEALVAKRVAKRFEIRKIDVTTFETEADLRQAVVESGIIKDDMSVDSVVKSLYEIGAVPKPAPKVKEKAAAVLKTPEFIPINVPKMEGNFNFVHDEEAEKNFSAYEEEERILGEKDTVFNDPDELDRLYNETLALEHMRSMETDDYYYEFAKAGLVRGGESEVKRDLDSLRDREAKFGSDTSEALVKNKKIASITEIALEYGVTNLEWFGEKMKVLPTSKFDDVRRGVDDVLEIIRDGKENNFMGLGIDVTYRGLHSEQYKSKVFNLLRSIKDGYKTKIKYFKDHDGNMMKEFAVPKAILYFNFNDVKNMAFKLKNISDPQVRAGYQNSGLKHELMNQIVTQCEILARFAKAHGNSIAESYADTRASLDEIAKDNPEIQAMLHVQHEDKTSRHLEELIRQFESENQKPEARSAGVENDAEQEAA